MKFLKFRDLPAGINAVTAISCYSGYNQEDSVILNQSAVDRGFFRSTFYRSYRDQARAGLVNEEFGIPQEDTCECKRAVCYEKLEADGLVAPGTRVSGDDIIIGKTTPVAHADDDTGLRLNRKPNKDSSTPLRSSETGIGRSTCPCTRTPTLAEGSGKCCLAL